MRNHEVQEILRAFEAARSSMPARGPGWAVGFRDERDRLLASFTLGSYDQVQHLAELVAPLGFARAILDEPAQGHDFVFRPDPAPAPPDLLAHNRNAPAAPGLKQAGAVLPPSRAAAMSRLERGVLVMEDTGGPVMLVSALSSDLAYCVWFDQHAALCSGTFSTSRLVNVDAARRRLAEVAAESPGPKHAQQ